eukprot:scaffold143139_cov19-Tisochrysis_lutea.AAC.4
MSNVPLSGTQSITGKPCLAYLTAASRKAHVSTVHSSSHLTWLALHPLPNLEHCSNESQQYNKSYAGPTWPPWQQPAIVRVTSTANPVKVAGCSGVGCATGRGLHT